MKIRNTPLPDLLILEPSIHKDERGHFFESYNDKTFFDLTGVKTQFVQDNQSSSTKGVIRGLHYQVAPMMQAKLVRVIQGEIWDVVVDIRKGSHTIGQWFGCYLSAEDKRQLWIPEGFAHGFLTLSNIAEISYKVSNYYDPTCERCLLWNDKDIGIKWPSSTGYLLSSKDRNGLKFQELISCRTIAING